MNRWSSAASFLMLFVSFCSPPDKTAKPTVAEQAAKTEEAKQEPKVDKVALAKQAAGLFGTPEPSTSTTDAAVESAQVELGRMLYYEKRLSKAQDMSCNSCHSLADYGVDVREKDGKHMATSAGHRGQLGDRNSPSSYYAYLHLAQFWDGRAKDVEEQAKGPVTNPGEMAMKSPKAVEKVLESIPGYRPKFKAAFPKAKRPISYDNMAVAIGAFERKLVTPSRFDAFMKGDVEALTDAEAEGLQHFVKKGCIACHVGPAVGGMSYQKLGLLKPYSTKDEGRFRVTKAESDKFVFKVPSLRNIEKTGPYLHDGSIETLSEMVTIMGNHQIAGGPLKAEEVERIVAFLKSLTGKIPEALIAEPEFPKNGPKTPKPDKT
jgi:cytochrome c peroxidase